MNAAPLALSSVLRPVDGLAVETFPDAALVWDENRTKLHHLDTLAAIVWDELDGRPLAAVAAGLANEFGADAEQVARDVLALARTLVDEGLLVADRADG